MFITTARRPAFLRGLIIDQRGVVGGVSLIEFFGFRFGLVWARTASSM